MKSMRRSLKRITSKKDVHESSEKATSPTDKQRPPFRPRPQMIIGYTHDSILELVDKFNTAIAELSADKLSSVPRLFKEYNSILEVIRTHHTQETSTYFEIVQKAEVDGAQKSIDAIVSAHEADEKEFVSFRAELKAAARLVKAKSDSAVKLDALKKSAAHFAKTQEEHVKLEEELYNLVAATVFQPLETSCTNMTKVLDTNRDAFEKVLLPALTTHILGTGRSGKLRQLIDSVQRSSSVEDFNKYREYFKSKISEKLWAKLCKLGYDKDLGAEESASKPEAKKEAAPKKKAPGLGAGRKSLRARLRAGDIVAIRENGERKTGEVLEIIDGGAKLVVRIKKESELHKDDLDLVLHVEKSKCKKVVSPEMWEQLNKIAEEYDKKEQESTEKVKESEKKKAKEAHAAVPLADEKVKKEEEKPKAAAKEEPKEETKEEAAAEAAPEKPKEEEKPKAKKSNTEVRVENPADGPFALLSLTNEALRLAVDAIAARIAELKADAKDDAAAVKKDYDALDACAKGRFALEDDKFVSKYVATNRVQDLRDERKYDATVRQGISELLGKVSDDASLKKLSSEYTEWADEFRAALKREEKLLRSGSPDAEEVIEVLQESVARERASFDADVEPFVSKTLEGNLLDSWKGAVQSVIE